ncbi:MAG: glycoside hydrolase family 32 protein [Pseudoramibacter sp.]
MQKDQWRLAFHLMPPDGWLNDPNGLCEAKGIYHVYFQYAPNTPAPDGRMARTWGHYAGPDLINLSFKGVPFWPETLDRDGCYSGSAFVEDDGTIDLYYTGNIKEPGDYDYIHDGRISNTILIQTRDGGQTYSEKRRLFGTPDYPRDCTRHVRDPKVWQEDDQYYMVLGARMQDDHGAVLFYESLDGLNWHLLKIESTQNAFGYMWECPDYFERDGGTFLSFCPQGLEAEALRFQNNHQAGYCRLQGPLRGKQLLGTFYEWDMGFDFYAPQSFLDERGRRILIGWAGLPDKPYGNPTADAEGWENCLTVPRVLFRKGDRLCQKPISGLKRLRTDPVRFSDGGRWVLPDAAGDAELQFNNPEVPWKIQIGTGVCLSYDGGVVTLSLDAETGCGRDVRRAAVEGVRNARLLIDRSILEIYLNGGETVMTSRYYEKFGENRSLDVVFDCEDADIYGWRMGSMPVNKIYDKGEM